MNRTAQQRDRRWIDRSWKREALLLLWLLLLTSSASALPRFTLLSGSRCSNCHFNPQGSGLRNELGWMTMNETGLLSLEDVGLAGLETKSNTYFSSHLTVGLDARFQSFEVGRPPDTRRLNIPMQFTPSIGLTFGAEDELKIYGGWNVATTKHRYEGQSEWNAAIQYQPSLSLPSIRVGMIQPSLGIRHDDHTMFVRQEAASSRSPVLPPDFNEYGAEVTYEGLHLLTLNAGIFDSHHLQETESTVDTGSLSLAGRVVVWPQFLDAGINTLVGGSLLLNGDYQMMNFFAGAGLKGKVMLYAEGMLMTDSREKELLNFSTMAQTQFWDWLAFELRYEWGETELPTTGPYSSNAFMVGAQFFPIPFLELRPEYRFYTNDEYDLGQFTLQLHAFY